MGTGTFEGKVIGGAVGVMSYSVTMYRHEGTEFPINNDGIATAPPLM